MMTVRLSQMPTLILLGMSGPAAGSSSCEGSPVKSGSEWSQAVSLCTSRRRRLPAPLGSRAGQAHRDGVGNDAATVALDFGQWLGRHDAAGNSGEGKLLV